MKVIFAVAFLAGSFYLIWWGYKHLIMRETLDRESGDMDGGLCHLCRRAFPKGELVVREKMGGFENYFCGECIEALHRDYEELMQNKEQSGV